MTALRADGSEAGSFHMAAGPTIIGRDSGGIFAGDSYLSPKHATFTVRGRQVVVRGAAGGQGRGDPAHAGEQPVDPLGGQVGARIGQIEVERRTRAVAQTR